jgi:hypothetical protein
MTTGFSTTAFTQNVTSIFHTPFPSRMFRALSYRSPLIFSGHSFNSRNNNIDFQCRSNRHSEWANFVLLYRIRYKVFTAVASSSQAPSSAPPTGHQSGFSTGAVAATSLGLGLLVGLVAAVLYCLYRRRRAPKKNGDREALLGYQHQGFFFLRNVISNKGTTDCRLSRKILNVCSPACRYPTCESRGMGATDQRRFCAIFRLFPHRHSRVRTRARCRFIPSAIQRIIEKCVFPSERAV